ncbi:MAG: TadE/TadG family type IV pilus assembly protein [Ilumatobacter sp.]
MLSNLPDVHDDGGSAGVETAFAVTALLLVLFFVVGGMRLVGADGDVSSAARAGARAAASARSSADADAAARAVVAGALSGRGVACTGGPRVSVSGAGEPGQAVTVEVSCNVSLRDVVAAGFPGTRTVSASAVEYVDQIRGER